LRLEGPLKTPPEAPAAKKFWLGESGTISAVAAAKARASAAGTALAQNNDAQRHAAKTRVSSAFLLRAEIFSRACAAEKFIGAHFSENRAVSAPRRRGAALTHKIKWSHCYFFPAVVIG
jgi:hypothetical protein